MKIETGRRWSVTVGRWTVGRMCGAHLWRDLRRYWREPVRRVPVGVVFDVVGVGVFRTA